MSNRLSDHSRIIRLTHSVGFWEGISYLLLLFVAMPLKYFMEFPDAVRWTGTLHGFLFVGFMAMLYYSLMTKALSVKAVVRAFLLSLIPFGTFYLAFDKSVN
jgi:integral membrane protein